MSVVFDADDIAAAFNELDARYLAGEAAAHAHTWSLVADAFAAINRHELPERPGLGQRRPPTRSSVRGRRDDRLPSTTCLTIVPDIHVYVEVVRRLGNLGAVVTQVGHGTSQEGFKPNGGRSGFSCSTAIWLSRYELFDETDLDAALARFDELQPQAPRLENAASQVERRFLTYFAARDWDAYRGNTV